jgi:mono/diheme cytochrome c family protein
MDCLKNFLAAVIWMVSGWSVASEADIDFARQVAPILSEHCVRCHSPGNQKGDISLATGKHLVDNDLVVVGDADASHLIDLVTAAEGETPAMPKDATPLAEADVAILRQWIEQGAIWPDDVVIREKSKADTTWWSLQPVREVLPPSSPAMPQSWKINPIDRFIFERLAKSGLRPRARADRRTLIRRLSFDLHGLPPTPESVEAFVNDRDPSAYENLVNRLLDSEHYGERYARHWLDIAHHADTHGFERDQRRDQAWRYRDYVINAFNDDRPYRRFLQEQIAGDVLWPDDDQAVIATGFLAAGPWDFVGQQETKSPLLKRAARSLDLDDMATQVMTAAMAVTINCARCHDHKLDPISQQEYYQLRAVFAGIQRRDRVISDVAMAQFEERQSELRNRLNAIDFEIGRLEGAGLNLADLVGGGNGFGTGQKRHGIDPRTGKIQTRDFGKLGNVVTNQFAPSDLPFIDGVFIPDGDDAAEPIPISRSGVTLAGLPDTSGDAWDVVRNGPVASQHSVVLDGVDFSQAGHSLLGLHANAGITFDLAAMRDALGPGAMRFSASLGYFGAEGDFRADAWVFVDGHRVAQYLDLNRKAGLQRVDVELPESAKWLTLIATDGGNGFAHDQVGWGDPYVKLHTTADLSAQQQDQLNDLRRQRAEAQAELRTLGQPPKFYGVAADGPVPEVRVLLRGDAESPIGEPLNPGALSALTRMDPHLGGLDSAEGDRRAALAQWITHRDNPLTPRVIVNRLWQWHFGKGLVDTPSDFGYGGGRPSHPELLDWLAAELDHQGGSLKAIHRLILTSQTYQQQSRFAEDEPAVKIDADNRLLWRQNPRRIEAEAIRDSVLLVSGKLNTQRGGPGFEDFEYQDAYAPIYRYVTADTPELWRRSIYRFVVRTTPDRFLTTLDCPDPANWTPRRLTTTTPLQALALYNNDFMLRQAEYFAERVERESGDGTSKQVERAFWLAFGRAPIGSERELAERFVVDHGLFALCRSLFNANEFVYVD